VPSREKPSIESANTPFQQPNFGFALRIFPAIGMVTVLALAQIGC
jgi:hypothetical protein